MDRKRKREEGEDDERERSAPQEFQTKISEDVELIDCQPAQPALGEEDCGAESGETSEAGGSSTTLTNLSDSGTDKTATNNNDNLNKPNGGGTDKITTTNNDELSKPNGGGTDKTTTSNDEDDSNEPYNGPKGVGVTETGVMIDIHGNERALYHSPFEIPLGDHLEAHLGPCKTVFHAPLLGLHVYVFPPNGRRQGI